MFRNKMENIKNFDRHNIKSVLVLYEDHFFTIGDSCITLDKLNVLKKYFGQARITINFLSSAPLVRYMALLENNPYLDERIQVPLESLNLKDYEVVICIVQDEWKIQPWLQKQPETPPVFSFSQVFFPSVKAEQVVYLPYEPLLELAESTVAPKELYISKEEKNWGESWLDLNGLKRDEQLFVLVDNASKREKMVSMGVYIEVLKWLLKIPKTKMLIFDEGNVGKEFFYKEMLGNGRTDTMIYSKGLPLRQDLCLLASDRVRLVIGPCTGLMHCASAIYNRYVAEGRPIEQSPAIVTYTGKNEHAAYYWWKHSPLTDVLVLRTQKGGKEMVLLKDLKGDDIVKTDNLLPCEGYTATMLISHLQKRLGYK